MKSDRPIQYQKGWVEFYKLNFALTPDVLIPRPETELLVDEVLKFIKDNPGSEYKVLELGTGSGNIAISLAKNNPDIKIIATDVSKDALKIALKNAKFHKVENRIKFIQSNLLENFNQNPDILVTNLPYIPSYRIPYLDSSVKDFEPNIALDGGSYGFDLYKKLFEQINEKSWQLKLIVCEIDYTQAEIALSEASKHFPNARIDVKLDLYHKQRILIIKS